MVTLRQTARTPIIAAGRRVSGPTERGMPT